MFFRVCAGVSLLLLAASPVFAQSTPPPPWKVSFGGGLAITSGNKDTSTYNASYAVSYAPDDRHTFKSEAFLIRGRTSGELSNDRLGASLREERRVNERVFVFGQGQYTRDRFKRIQYLVAPTAGVGFTLLSNDDTTIAIDAGAGGVWEKNPFADVRASGALTFNQKLTQAISSTTTVTQSLAGLWKTEDLGDGYYQLAVTASLAISTRVQFKIEAVDTYNTRPTGVGIQKNDVSMVFALVFRN